MLITLRDHVTKILLFSVNSLLKSLLSVSTQTQNAPVKLQRRNHTNYQNGCFGDFWRHSFQTRKRWPNFKCQPKSILTICCNLRREIVSMPDYSLK